MIKKILFLLLVVFSQTARTQDLNTQLAEVFNDFDLMGMSVWVATNNTQQVFNYGFRDYARELLIDENTKFRIASISKAFTALGLLKLHDQGAFGLDDDISGVLGYTVRNPQYPAVPITYRMLLSHQSSLQDGTGYNDFLNATFNNTPLPNISELLLPTGTYYTANMWRTESPGSFFTYSNINFGLIGALIEKHSGLRFDVFMKSEILEPLTISGSYNIQDVPNINDIAVLYRNQGGWQPQIDNYEGVYPTPPDLSEYIPGTNGVYFAPQGGLRVSSSEIGNYIDFLRLGGNNGNLTISGATLAEMTSIQWDYNGGNGDNYFGLFNRWGLGLHHANVNQGDQICNLGSYDSFLGHPGEAYGLISDAFFSETEEVSFGLLINGNFNGYQLGNNSSFYQVEEAVFAVLCTFFENQLSIDTPLDLKAAISPNPASKIVHVQFPSTLPFATYWVRDSKGSLVLSSEISSQKDFTIDTGLLDTGLYFLYISAANSSASYKLIID